MNKANSDSIWLAVALDRRLSVPLQGQLAGEIRRLVHAGQLSPGDRLPASRLLAEELSVSRITVTEAYDQLASEGYIVGRRGAGMFIAPELSGLPHPPEPGPAPQAPPPVPPPLRPFDTASPDTAEFPHGRWARAFDRVWRAPEPALLTRADPLGWGPLRAAIARHLRDWRGIACAPAQVVVTSGLGEAIDLIARAALSPGNRVAVEEPGHGALRAALEDNGLLVWPVPVDSDGIDPECLDSDLGAVVVTPSRQFPLGMTLPLARRLRLLHWAEAAGAIVIEDDYDGEFRYRGQPLPAMMRLDTAGRAIYVGSFSKVLFPGLRLGFMVLPEPLVEPVRSEMVRLGARASLVAQPVLARFIEEGDFATHLRRMRRLYAHRQRVLVAEVQGSAGDLLEAEEGPSGMHLVARLASPLSARMGDIEASERARGAGVTARPLSGFFAGQATLQGLVLGFAGFGDEALRNGVERLAAALRA